MNVDPGVAIGIAGSLLASISLVYARTQAHAQRRQVEEMQRQNEELRRAQHFETSHSLMKDAIEARQQWIRAFRNEWIPPALAAHMHEALELVEGSQSVLFDARVYVEQLQEMFFARKADLVEDDHWRAMHRFIRGFFAPEVDRKLFHLFVEVGWLTDEFAQFGRDFMSTAIWLDPLGRLPPVQGLPLDKPM